MSDVRETAASRWSPVRRPHQLIAAAAAAVTVLLVTASSPLAAGVFLLALAALVVGWRCPYLLGPVVAALLPAGERFVVFGAQVSLLETVVGGGAAGYLIRLAQRPSERRLRAEHWAFGAFVVGVALSTLGPVDDSDQLRQLVLWGSLGVLFHAVGTHLTTRFRLRLVLAGLVCAGLIETTSAVWQYLDAWSDRFSLRGGAIVFPLPDGTLQHSNALAHFLVLASLAVLALALSDSGWVRRLGVAVGVALAVALVVTFSRGSWIAFLAGGAVWALDQRMRRHVLLGAALVGGGGTALALLEGGAIGQRISSLFTGGTGGLFNFRLELVRRAAHVVAANPITGAGEFREAGVYAGRPDEVTHPHNLFLGVAVFFGIPAALAFAAVVGLAFRTVLRDLRARSGDERRRAIGFLAVLVALLVNGLFEYQFWHPSLATLVVLVLAASMSSGTRLHGLRQSCAASSPV